MLFPGRKDQGNMLFDYSSLLRGIIKVNKRKGFHSDAGSELIVHYT